MTRFEEAQHTVTGWLGIRQKTPWERITSVDWQHIVPSRQDLRGMLPQRRATDRFDFDTTSLVTGIVVGVGIGVGLGYALAKAARPANRRRMREAVGRVEDTLREVPSRLNITRMEEPSK